MHKINSFDEIESKIISKKGIVSNFYLMPEETKKIILAGELFETDAENGFAWVQKKEGRNQFFYRTDIDSADAYECKLPDDDRYVAEIIHLTAASERYTSEKYILSNCGFHLVEPARMMARKPSSVAFVPAEDHRIRPAVKADERIVSALLHEAFDPLTDAIPTGNELKQTIENGEMWIDEDTKADKILGCAVFELSGKRAWVRHVTVDKKMRGQGIAKELLLTYISRKGPATAYALWVRDGNQAAIQLYRKAGFEETPRQMDIWVKA
ncbi:MAG: GNAT family N-acetyltransferase [Clostridia bacterium]|nr:GNAT family N-acetyltransferase [Clostridia bacterium]